MSLALVESEILHYLIKEPRTIGELYRLTRIRTSVIYGALVRLFHKGLVRKVGEKWALTELGRKIALTSLAMKYAELLPQTR